MPTVNKKVSLRLIGLDGNAFSLMGAFQSQARKEKWTAEEIKSVIDEAMAGDYRHLVGTLADHCENPGGYDCDEDDWEDAEDDDWEDE
jgi:hypothetical protein